MKKSILAIVTFATLFIFSSAHYQAPADSKVGHDAPGFSISNNDNTVALNSMKGKFVLLSFWSSTDAESRISNIRYDKAVKEMDNNSLKYVAVNFDPSESVYGEIVKLDNVSKSAQFYDQEGRSSRLFTNYHLDQGFRSYLINPEGRIIAQNPTPEQVATLIKL